MAGLADLFDSWRSRESGGQSSGSGDDLMVGYVPGSTQHLASEAQNIYNQEQIRYGRGMRTAGDAYRDSRQILGQGIDTDLAFGKAADSVGAQSKRALESLRASFSNRNINLGSGAAEGALSRLALGIQGSLVGARRDIAFEDQRTRQTNAGVNFANAMNLAQYQNAPTSGILYENSMNMYEGNLAREGLNAQMQMSRDANQTNVLSSILGAVPVIGGVLGGLA